LKIIVAIFLNGGAVSSIDNSYNAYKVGIRDGDLIKKLNNKKMRTIDDVMLEFQLIESGSDVTITYERDGKLKTVTIRPTKEVENEVTRYVYGISFSSEIQKGFINSIKYSFTKFGSIFRNMIKVIGSLITGKLGVKSLSGPVGIYTVIGEQSKLGFENVIYLAAYISINVGFVNMIPFPAFDGGRALFLIIEKIRKKPIDQKTENIIHTIGFVLLMVLIVVITINDIIRLF